jgi:hypothetical protein
MRRRLGRLSVLSITMVLLFAGTGCDQFMQDIIRESIKIPHLIDPDEATILDPFDEDSYFPIIDGYRWTYNNGAQVEVQVDSDAIGENRFIVKNLNYGNGEFEGSVYQNGDFYQANQNGFSNPRYLPPHDYFGFSPIALEDEQMYIGSYWTYTEGSGEETQRLEVTGVNKDILTPGGLVFNNCIELTRTITYHEEYHWDVDLLKVEYYLCPGVGYVYEKRYWDDDSVEFNYVIDYTHLGETLSLETNTLDNVSPSVSAEILEEGQEIRLPLLHREGFVNVEWNTSQDGTGTTYQPNSIFIMPDADVSLYAVWEAVE